MTSLAAQLKKLAVPETQSLLTGDLRQASFLYDEGEAATYDKQHFYNIGVNGLLQLIEKDDRFSVYEQTLFSPSSQSLQRFVQSTEVNAQLDISISTFLLQLSPYMQLREAHKALEWMVHRYNVHLRNVNDLMMCLLPYHDQEIFVRGLRLLKLNSQQCAMWKWLEPTKKGNVFLARQTLVTHCRSAKGFLGFFCDMLRKHIQANTNEDGTPQARQLQRVISFYTQTVLALLVSAPPSEYHISVLIPAVSAGLKARQLPDYCASSYMILSQLCNRVTLDGSVLEALVNVIAKNVDTAMLESAMSLLVLMFQKQPIQKLSKKAFKYLSHHSTLVPTLAHLSQEVNTEPFLAPFVRVLAQRLLKSGHSSVSSASDSNVDDDVTTTSPLSLMLSVLGSVKVEKDTVYAVARVLLDWFTGQGSEVKGAILNQEGPAEAAFTVFRLLENRYSPLLDALCSDMLQTDPSIQPILDILYTLSVDTAKEELTSDPVTSLTVCLHHRNPGVRRQAVERLLNEPGLLEDVTSVQAAVVLRLQDDEPLVVTTLLKQSENLWELFTDKTLLHDTLLKKYQSLGRDQDSSELHHLLLQALLSVPFDVVSEKDLNSIVLATLMVDTQVDIKMVKAIFNTSFGLSNKLLEVLAKTWLPSLEKVKEKTFSVETTVTLWTKLANQVTAYLLLQPNDAAQFLSDLHSTILTTTRSGHLACLILLVYMNLLDQVKTTKVKVHLQNQLMDFIMDITCSKSLVKSKTDVYVDGATLDTVLAQCLTCVEAQGRIPLVLILYVILNAQFVHLPAAFKDVQFWDLTNDLTDHNVWLQSISQALVFLWRISFGKKCSPTVGDCFNKIHQVLGGTDALVKLLCAQWTSGHSLSGQDKAHSVQFAKVYISTMTQEQRAKLATSQLALLPCLLLLLANQSENVRQAALTLIKTVYEDASSESVPSAWLALKLLSYKEEIIQDPTFLRQSLKNILEGDHSATSPPSPKRRRKSSSKIPASTLALHSLLDLVCNDTTPLSVRAGLLDCLSRLDSPESFLPLSALLGRVMSSIVTSGQLSMTQQAMVSSLLHHYTPTVADCIQDKTDCQTALLECLKSSCSLGKQTVQMTAVERLTPELVSSLPFPSRQAVFQQLVHLICQSDNLDLARLCRKCIKRMRIESSILVHEMKVVTAKPGVASVRQAKLQKGCSKEELSNDLDSVTWRRLTAIFEMIQNKKKIIQAVDVIPEAFHVLARVLELETQGSGEYLKQLILGTIYNLCQRQVKEKQSQTATVQVPELNLDLVVQCIRSSDNAHTHHQALLLLSSAALIAPDLLLHNMMSIFTFMGANILRQDDAYSFHVIGRILENVIPALIMACEAKSVVKSGKKSSVKSSRSAELMTVVLGVFVDAIPHIPAHRKMPLFGKLLSVLGAKDYLWRLVLLVIERVTTRPARATDEGDMEVEEDGEKPHGPIPSQDLDFLLSVTEKFDATQLVQCCSQILDYIAQLPQDKQGDVVAVKKKDCLSITELSRAECDLFSVDHHTGKQLRHFKYGGLFVLKEMVTSQNFVAMVSNMDPGQFLPDFQTLMETVLQLIGQMTQSHDTYKGEQRGAKFWRVILHKAHDLMDGLISLLPDAQFLDVVSSLMSHDLPLVKRRALELLNAKLVNLKDQAKHEEIPVLTGLVSRLDQLVTSSLLRDQEEWTDEELVIGQLALYGLKVLCRILGNRQDFLKVLDLCVQSLSTHTVNGMVCASAMLCAAEVVSQVKVHALEHLPNLMPHIVTQLGSDTIAHQEVLLMSAITALQKIMEALPLFLSPYLKDIIVQVCCLTSVQHKPAVNQKVKMMCTAIATVTPTRSFLPVLEKSFLALQDKMVTCSDVAMTMLKDHIVTMTREDLTTFSQDLLKFFLVCFDLRSTHTEMSESHLELIESCTIDAFVSLVFKLSEAQFKPMLLQIYTWATDLEQNKDRVLTFYKLCQSLAVKLKNLFTLFAGHILKHSAQVLDLNNKSKGKCKYFGSGKLARSKSCILLTNVLDCLHQTFTHDTEGFLTKERFDVVMQPLVDQLENDLGKDSENRVLRHVVPCLASLAAAAQDDAMWKDLNYQILLKTRHEDTKVKLWALSAIDAFHRQLGEDYTQLVPETIPFLAELMEDDSDEVEKMTHKVLAGMETSVGENLQEYF